MGATRSVIHLCGSDCPPCLRVRARVGVRVLGTVTVTVTLRVTVSVTRAGRALDYS